MPSRWLFRPLPLRERVGRGVAAVSSTLRRRRLVVPSPPHPNPLPQGEREPEVPSAKGVIATSTVLALDQDLTLCRRLAPDPAGWQDGKAGGDPSAGPGSRHPAIRNDIPRDGEEVFDEGCAEDRFGGFDVPPGKRGRDRLRSRDRTGPGKTSRETGG